MRVVLELRCPKNVDGISVDPEPNWNLNDLLSEINSLEIKLNQSSAFSLPFTKTKSRDTSYGDRFQRKSRPFVMRVPDLEDDDDEDMDDDSNRSLVVAKRFGCDVLYLSDDSDDDDEWDGERESYLMNKVGLVESVIYELTYEHQLEVKEEIRNQISAFETEMMGEIQTSTSALARVEKYREARRVIERRLDLQYQRKLAEALDSHLTAVQREHEMKSQIEERKIKNDAAFEEEKRKAKALLEGKLNQEKARAEAERQAKLRAEEAKRAALEAEKRAAKEAADREVAESLARVGAASGQQMATTSESANAQAAGSPSNMLRAAESALMLERQRLQKLKELNETNQSLRSSSNEDFSRYQRIVYKVIKQIRGTKENVSTKAGEIAKIFNDSRCPQSISIATFAEKVVSHCESLDNAPFACGYVIVLVTSQFPHAMDVLLAELHKACIYTVPKHIVYSESAFGSNEAYRRAIGFREDAEKMESVINYLKRLESYMKLYGALVQTEIGSAHNSHGLQEGWAWIARFTNTAPANKYTAVALNSFLKMAGYSLHMKYKSQFRKILSSISKHFLSKLKARAVPELAPVISSLQHYIEDQAYLQEPEGRSLPSLDVVSSQSDHASQYGYQHSYGHSSGYTYHR